MRLEDKRKTEFEKLLLIWNINYKVHLFTTWTSTLFVAKTSLDILTRNIGIKTSKEKNNRFSARFFAI